MSILEKKISECSHANVDDKTVCMETEVIDKLRSGFEPYLTKKQVDTRDAEKVIETIKDVVGCGSESCILTKPEVKDVIGHDVAKQQLETQYKPEGPYNSKEWFSNFNIDNVLKQVAEKYKDKNFLHIEFQMRDFATTNGKLSHIDIAQKYKEGIRCFGVVFNTDTSKGNGQHWFAVFGDLSQTPMTIEYFNSSGDPPLPEICLWMKTTKHHLIKELNKNPKDVESIVVTKLVNQSDNHSCGSYSLYYIMSRLAGIPYKHFQNTKIGDSNMHKFRKEHLFRFS